MQATRERCRREHGHLALMDLWLGATFAEDLDEVAVVGHLGLLLFGLKRCRQPLHLSGRALPSLADVIGDRRRELGDRAARSAEAWERHREAADIIRTAERGDRKARRGYLDDVRKATTTPGATR